MLVKCWFIKGNYGKREKRKKKKGWTHYILADFIQIHGGCIFRKREMEALNKSL